MINNLLLVSYILVYTYVILSNFLGLLPKYIFETASISLYGLYTKVFIHVKDFAIKSKVNPADASMIRLKYEQTPENITCS